MEPQELKEIRVTKEIKGIEDMMALMEPQELKEIRVTKETKVIME